MITDIIISTFIFIHIFYALAVVRQNFSIIDIGWGLGILLSAIVAFVHNGPHLKNLILLILVTIWAVRLATYVFLRGRGKGEDPRYTKFRRDWEPHANFQAWIKVFLLQGILMMIVALPVSAGMSSDSQMSFINWMGVLVWGIGFVFEVHADSYLNNWKNNPDNKGKVCMSGPWSYCRFPNYFGEVLLWYGMFLVGFDFQTSWAIIGSITINFFILKVTGVPPIENKYMKRADYREYAERVPRFIPFTTPGSL